MGLSKSGGGRDCYPTPQIYADFAVQLAVQKVLTGSKILTMLEPGCGTEAPFAKAFKSQCPENSHAIGMDIEPSERTELTRGGVNFLDDDHDKRWASSAVEQQGGWDIIATNPPYSIAEEFIRKSLRILHPSGVAVFLLRIGFAGSIKRMPLFRERPPVEIGEFVRRFSFDGKGTDYTDYCLFFWVGDALDKVYRQMNHGQISTRFYWIDNSKKDNITTFGI